MADNNEVLIPELKKIFGPLNTKLKKDLAGYNMSELYAPLLGLIFIISFAISVPFAYNTSTPNDLVSFVGAIFIYGILAAIAFSFLLVYVFLPLYKHNFKTSETLNVTLGWQIIALVFATILTFATASVSYIYGGLIIFLLLLFVYPLLSFLTTQPTETAKVKSTLHKLYVAITIIIYIIQLVIQFAHL